MKLGTLKGIGHNFADSFASGLGLLIGYYAMNVFAEAAAADEGYLIVDFITGATYGAPASESLQRAVHLYRDTLPEFCERHGVNAGDIRVLQVRFGTDVVHGPHFTVTVENHAGRRSVDRYVGIPGKRLHRARKM
ncbi:hypothetical protein FHW58_000752 [Duganella sp. 1224]|uniref:hypothetical protein n=1 Tax=Duganella sp. 1224 TaxID=2587052 RepID=UPI0015CA55AB|nr:hypothetical protein [Duganella sp. 1224]NYE59600.1 hypothetical protein [Duganella sp. 1224]